MEDFKLSGTAYKIGLTLLDPYIMPVTRITPEGKETKLYFFKKMPRRAIVAAFQENDKAKFYRTKSNY